MRRAAAGAALVLVLWLIVLLTALVGAFVLDARVEAMQGSVLRSGAQADELARAGVEYALARLQVADPGARWRPDGRRYRWRFDGAQVDLWIRDEAGKVDLNSADVPLLTALLQALGAPDGQAQRLAGAIVDWRDADDLSQPGGGAEDADYAEAGLPYGAKDAPFESIGELRRVLGMSPELYRKLLPEVTVFGNRGRPDPRYASAAVLQALGLDAAAQLAQRDQDAAAAPVEAVALGGTFGIESRVRLGNGREAVLRAVVRTGVAPQSGAAYTVLRWDEGREQ